MFKKLVLKIHRWLGIAFSLIFVLWFVSGIVMVFESFPRVDRNFQFAQSETITAQDSIQDLPSEWSKSLLEISLRKVAHRVFYELTDTLGNTSYVDARTLNPIQWTSADLDTIVHTVYTCDYLSREEINDFDQWIPWSGYAAYFPIYKYHLNDDKHTVVYLSQKTGTVVQETTRYTRWMARVGAIPHWFYYKHLRLKSNLWIDVVIWISLLACLATLSGTVMGFIRQRKKRKKGLFGFSPYKHKWRRWHHVFGYIFGVFVLTFAFSGFMSVYDVPQWIVPEYEVPNYWQVLSENSLDDSGFDVSVNDVLIQNKGIKKIVWKTIENQPFYFVYQASLSKPVWYSANRSEPLKIKRFLPKDVDDVLVKALPNMAYSSELLSESDGYLRFKVENNQRLLKIITNDTNQTWLYFDLDRYQLIFQSNSNTRLRRWLYNGLHSFNFKFLEPYEWLRKLILVVLCVFGAIISISGVVLSYQYLERKFKKYGR